jgi:integrase
MTEIAEMQFVQRVVSAKDGRERLYFRKKGHGRRPLKSAWGTEDLRREVQAILDAEKPQRALPGLLRGALRLYEEEDADFAGLADSTKYLYRAMLDELAVDFGDVPIERFTAAYLLELRNIWAARGHRAANLRLQVLKNALWPMVIAGRIAGGDPFAMIPPVRRPAHLKEPNPIWPHSVVLEVVSAAIDQQKFGLARAVALARWTGARRGDLVRMTARCRAAGRIRFLSGKRRVPVDIEEDADLAHTLAATPATQPKDPRRGRKLKATDPSPFRPLTLVYNLEGSPYTEDGLALELGKLTTALAAAGRIDGAILDPATGQVCGCIYGLHGLRHTRGVELALAGCTDAQGAAMMGHASPSSFAQYRRQADRIRMSDDGAQKVRQLRERQANDQVKNQVENRCKTGPATIADNGS